MLFIILYHIDWDFSRACESVELPNTLKSSHISKMSPDDEHLWWTSGLYWRKWDQKFNLIASGLYLILLEWQWIILKLGQCHGWWPGCVHYRNYHQTWHWIYDINIWGLDTEIFLKTLVNTIAAAILAPRIAKSSGDVISNQMFIRLKNIMKWQYQEIYMVISPC